MPKTKKEPETNKKLQAAIDLVTSYADKASASNQALKDAEDAQVEARRIQREARHAVEAGRKNIAKLTKRHNEDVAAARQALDLTSMMVADPELTQQLKTTLAEKFPDVDLQPHMKFTLDTTPSK